MPPREDIVFFSHGLRCAAWLYQPDAPSPAPLIVMAHGLGAIRELGLDAYARRFSAAGFAVLAFDYRHYGGSDGEPRELFSVTRQLEDFRAAIAFAKTLPGVDPARIAAWGSSFGGGHVIRLASEGHGLCAAIAQVPFSSGLASTAKLPLRTALRITGHALLDLARAAVGMSPHYIGVVGQPGEIALMTAPDCYAGYRALVPPELEASGHFRNRICARAGLEVPLYAPGRSAEKIAMPLLLAIAERDSIAPAKATHDIGKRAPRAEIKSYPDGHFDYYQGAGFTQIVTDELEFLQRHLLRG